MTKTREAPGTSSRGASETAKPTDASVPRWTDADLLLMHEVGREYERARLVELVEELSLVALMPPAASYEERVAARVALFEACAWEMAARLAAHVDRAARAPAVSPTKGEGHDRAARLA